MTRFPTMPALLLLLLSCGTAPEPVGPGVDDTDVPDDDDGGEDTAQAEVVELTAASPARLLRRLSIDLLGELPTLEEYQAVEANPAQVDVLRDAWLEDPRFEERLVFLLQERWRTRVDFFEAHYFDYLLEDELEYTYERSVGEEPLRLMARIVVEDRSWTEIVTADHTMANGLLRDIWDLVDHPGGDAWEPARYTDGRPAVGVLATNGLWWRYPTTSFNQNRSRAAMITSQLLCQDLLQRPVKLTASRELLQAENTTDMVRSEASCLACHAIIEPLAASIYGFYWTNDKAVTELETYHPEREILGPKELDVEPALFGTPISGLSELGPAIAADPRFSACAVETWAEILLRRRITVDDLAMVQDLTVSFEAGGMKAKELIRELTSSEEYRADGLTDEASDATAEAINISRMLTADQLASMSAALTGFSWTHEGFDMLDNDEVGHRILGGGVDGEFLSRPQQDPGLTWALVVKRLAEGSAWLAFAHESGQLSEPDAFELRVATLEDSPGDPAFDQELEELLLRLHGERPETEMLAAYAGLWSSIDAESDAIFAWRAVLTAAMRDPRYISY